MTTPSGNSANFSVIIDLLAKDEATFDRISKQVEHITGVRERAKEIERLYREEIKKIAPELLKQVEAQQKITEEVKEQNKQIQLQSRELRARAATIRAEANQLKSTAGDLDKLFNPLAAGGAIVTGGIFAAVTKYVSDA